MPIALFLLSLLTATLSTFTSSWGMPLNIGLLETQANEDAALTLQDVPRNMTAPSVDITIRWTPNNVQGTLRYASNYNGDTPDGYQNSIAQPVDSRGGMFRFHASDLPVGYLYCIIDGGNAGYSVVFNIIRVSESAPAMVAPITAAGRLGINTITPAFRWEAINGVPFYHVIVSDQPFEITEDEQGTRVEGANVIWQAITSETSIQFGIPDPSEFFDNDQTPPLIGSMNRQDRPRYAWVVLANYGNHPAYTSSVTGGVSGFEVEVAPPFDEPENIAPQTRSTLDGAEILFRWSEVEEAVSYFVYVSREEISAGGSRALVPAWNAQTTFTSIACPARDVLPNGRFVWKVLAASRQGHGTISDTTSFTYDITSGELITSSFTLSGNVLENVTIEVEPVDGPSVMAFATDDNGYSSRQIAVGSYRFRGIKAGYVDTLSAVVNIEEDRARSIALRLRPIPSGIVGTVVDEEGDPIGGAIVTASMVPGGEETVAETNVSGAYQLVVAPANYLINVTANGYLSSEEISVNVPRSTMVDLNADNGPITLETYRFTISGYVRNANGQPINSATVLAVSPDGSERRFYTPEAGNYSFLAGPGRWRLNATKPGFYLESGEVPVDISNRDAEVNFTLLPQAGIFSGQVLIDGNPANRNADVWLIPSAGEVTTTTVNQVGAFSRGVSPGDYVAVAVREGYHTTDSLQLSIDPGETISGLRLNLEANASSIAGRITDGGGNSLRDATVTAGGVNVVTDANGNYTLRLAAGSHTVVATKASYVTAQQGPVSVQAGQNIRDVNFRLNENAGTITGRVRRGNDAIFEAVVTATRQDGNRAVATTRTARDGTYTFGLSFGNYRLTVQKDGFVAAAPGIIDVQLQPGQVVNGRDFPMLSYSGRIAGSITSPAGAVNTPTIRITQLDDANRTYSTNGNVEGNYALGIAPERRYIVSSTKAGFNTVTDTTARLGIEGEIIVNQRLTPLPSTFSGTVTSAGQPLAGATIRADGQAGTFQSTSDRLGRYSISLQPGQYRLTTSKPGYTAVERELRINPGEIVGGIDFAPEPNFALISGLIRDPDGGAIASANVTAIDSINQRTITSQTNADGAYQLESIIPGNYHLIVTRENYRRNSVNLGAVVGRQERRGVNVALTPLAANIIGRVLANGNPVASVTIYATEAEGEQYSASSDNNGRYTLYSISDGNFTVRPARAGYTGVVRENIALDPADTITVDLELIPNDGRITGFVRDPDGAGLRNTTVSAMDSLGNFATAASNAAGEYSLDNLFPRTRYLVTARLANHTAETDTFRNVATGNAVNFRLLPNELRLTGRVVNQGAQAIAATDMVATSESDGSVFRATSNQAGDFTFVGLAPRTRYRIQTQRSEDYYANVDTTIQVAANHLDIGPRIRIIERRATVQGRITSNNVGVRDVSVTSRNIATGRQRTTYTSADGTYRIIGMRGGDLNNYNIWASKPGFIVRQPDSLRVDGLGITEVRQNVNFVVEEVLVDISGRVIDSAGVSMDGIPVVIWSEAGRFIDTTEANGVFSFVGLYPHQHYSLSTELSREGYANASAELDAGDADISGVVLTVGRHNATIRGLITNAQGVPVTGVAVTLDGGGQVIAANDGTYRFNFVSPGVHRLEFIRAGFLSQQADVDAQNGEGEVVRNVSLVVLDRAIFGTASQRGSAFLLEGVVIRLASDAGDTLYDTTGARGTFQFNGLDPVKNYSIFTVLRGYESISRTGLNIAAGNIDASFVISPPAQGIYGRLRMADGSPVPGAEIRIRSFNNQLYRDVTNYYGDYQVIVGEGTYSVIGVANAPLSGNSRSINVVVAGGSGVRRDLQIESTGRATGRLVLGDGTPPVSVGRIVASHDVTGDVYFDIAAANGTFELAGLRPGEYTLSAEAAGYAMEISPFRFIASLGETNDLTIAMTQSGKAITGYVKNEAGDGISRARVTLTGNSPGQFETDGKGYWTKLAPLAGRYTLAVERIGYTSPPDTSFDLPAGGIMEITRIVTPTLNSLSGRLLNTTGQPYPDGKIYLFSGGRAVDSVMTNRYGEYQFAGLTPRTYFVRISVPGYTTSPNERRVDLVQDAYELDIEFTLVAVRGFGVVRGTVRHDGAPIIAQVSIIDLQTGSRIGVNSNVNGTYHITGISTPSTFRLTATYPNVPGYSSESFLLETGQDQTHDLSFPTGQIVIRLLNSEGNPIVGRRVFVSGITTNYTAILYSDAAGVTSTENWLPPATYSVVPEALVGSLPSSPEVFDLGNNEVKQLTWHLGWRITPPPPFSFEDSARVQITVPSAISVADANLYIRGPGASSFTALPLIREAAGGAPGRSSRSVAPETPVIAGFDATVIYYAYIPPQGRSGTLTYYLQVSTTDGFLFGGPETAIDVTVTARGLLDRLELIRSQAALQPRPGVAIKLVVTGYDDGNNDLTTRLHNEGTFEWTQTGEIHGRLVVDSQDSSIAIYYPETPGPVSILSKVSQPIAGVVVTETIEWNNVESAVSRLQIAGQLLTIRAGEALVFTVTATDTAGVLVPVAPVWVSSPSEVATIEPVPFSMNAVLQTRTGVIGKVQITATDTIADISAIYNSDSPDRSQHGLAIYGEIRSSNPDTTRFEDGLGFKVLIPPGSLSANSTARLYLNEPRLTPVFRLTTKFELAAVGYNLGVDGNLSRNGSYTLVLPVPVELPLKTPTVGVWNAANIDWDVITGEFNTDSTAVTIRVSSLDGLYALISASEVLGVRNLKFSPNPFSPYATIPGLSLDFRLTSDMADRPNLSVMIYNMQGQLVRKLIDSRLMPKGDYRRGGENEIIWDGRTDDGLEARNGRYIIVLTAKDASGESKVVDSAVLVK